MSAINVNMPASNLTNPGVLFNFFTSLKQKYESQHVNYYDNLINNSIHIIELRDPIEQNNLLNSYRSWWKNISELTLEGEVLNLSAKINHELNNIDNTERKDKLLRVFHYIILGALTNIDTDVDDDDDDDDNDDDDDDDGHDGDDDDVDDAPHNGGNKKRGKTRKKHKRITFKKRIKKERKWTDTSYPYKDVSKSEAIKDFLVLRKLVESSDLNPNSIAGNAIVNWGTEKARRKTKYRNKSFIEKWKNKKSRKKVIKFAKRIKRKSKSKKSNLGALHSAVDLQWGTVNTMRAAAAASIYKKYNATRVLDFTAGWGARMIAAMALDIDYIGIDSNKGLKSGYNKIINLLKPYTKSKITMIFKKAENVNFKKLDKYDFVFTSPPYEYLEVYENMTNYEGKGKIKQPSSSQTIKMKDSEKFYDDFLIPTLKMSYSHLPKNKYICLNIPDIMYEKIKRKWKSYDKKDVYKIGKRHGSKMGWEGRRGKEQIFCWKK
jgi:16S rRNA G966 N2-methylase RsmD